MRLIEIGIVKQVFLDGPYRNKHCFNVTPFLFPAVEVSCGFSKAETGRSSPCSLRL